MQLAALAPWRFLALAGEQVLHAPFNPLGQTELGHYLEKGYETIAQMGRPPFKPPFRIDKVKFRGVEISVREEILDRSPFCELIHFKRSSADPALLERMTKDPKVLLITPLSGHCSALMRDTVMAMLPSHDVYLTDWADAKMVPLAFGGFDLEDQIAYLIRAIRLLEDELHIVALSQSSFSALSAVALLAQADAPLAPRSLTLIRGPIDASRAVSPLAEVALTHPLSWFRETQIQLVPPYYPGAFRAVYPGFMRLQNRMALIFGKEPTAQKRHFEHLAHGCEETKEAMVSLYEAFLAVTDVPAELYLRFVEEAYQKSSLAHGLFTVHGRKVDPAAIRHTALLTVEAELDELSPPGQTRAALDLCTGLPANMKQAHLEIGVGHYGVFTGRKWRNTIQPLIHAFIRQHCSPV